jgi:hypothetical protein
MKRHIDLQTQAHSLGMSEPATAAPHIFPTSSRAKHSKLLSYPLGAEILSRTLEGVPQNGHIACSFRAGDPHHHRRPKVKHLPVLHVTYQPWRHHQQWVITVFAVPRHYRHQIRTALIERVLPNYVRNWFLVDGYHPLYASFELETEQLVERYGY